MRDYAQQTNARDNLFAMGRILFSAAIAFFGIQYLFYQRFVGGLPPGQVWTPNMPIIADAFGAILSVAAILLFVPKYGRVSALVIGIIYCAGVVLINFGHVGVVMTRGNERTGAFEPLAIGASALMLAGALTRDRMQRRAVEIIGRALLGLCLCVFGVQHFLYTAYIASLLPSWVPAHTVLVYAAGVGFIAAGISIATNVKARLGAALLGVQWILFVILVQVPALVPNPTGGALWTSLFVPIALSGGAWILASAPSHQRLIFGGEPS